MLRYITACRYALVHTVSIGDNSPPRSAAEVNSSTSDYLCLQGTSLTIDPQPRGELSFEEVQVPCNAKVKIAAATLLTAEPPSAPSDHTGNCPSGAGEARLATMFVEEREVSILP